MFSIISQHITNEKCPFYSTALISIFLLTIHETFPIYIHTFRMKRDGETKFREKVKGDRVD